MMLDRNIATYGWLGQEKIVSNLSGKRNTIVWKELFTLACRHIKQALLTINISGDR